MKLNEQIRKKNNTQSRTQRILSAGERRLGSLRTTNITGSPKADSASGRATQDISDDDLDFSAGARLVSSSASPTASFEANKEEVARMEVEAL